MSNWNQPQKYDAIGADYNQTRKPDPYLLSRMRALLRLDQVGLYLDIGCGTGNYTGALMDGKYRFIGIDPSTLMLSQAQHKHPNGLWKQGKAEDTGLEDGMVDGVLASLTIHHWMDLKLGFKELRRVLKKEGRVVVFTSTSEQMKGYWLNAYFPKMMKDSMDQMSNLDAIKGALSSAGFNDIAEEIYNVRPDLKDHFLYCGKEAPKMYLDPMIRSGISSFSHLANLEEVGKGLIRLQEDIRSGRINEVMEDFRNNTGDYMFVTATS